MGGPHSIPDEQDDVVRGQAGQSESEYRSDGEREKVTCFHKKPSITMPAGARIKLSIPAQDRYREYAQKMYQVQWFFEGI